MSSAQWRTRGDEAGERLSRSTAPQPFERVGTDDYCSDMLTGAAVFVPCRERPRPETADTLLQRIDEGLNGTLPDGLAKAVGGCVNACLGRGTMIYNDGRKKVIKCFNDDVAVSSGYRRSAVNLGNVVVPGPKGVGKTSMAVTYAAAVAKASNNVVGLYFNLATTAVIPADPYTVVAVAMLAGGRDWLDADEIELLRKVIKKLEYPDRTERDCLLEGLGLHLRLDVYVRLGKLFRDKGLGVFFAIDEADLLYHTRMAPMTFNRWRVFLSGYAESSPDARARGGLLPMSWALTGSGSRLRSYAISENHSIDEGEDRTFRRDFPITNSTKVQVCNLSTESSFEEFCGAVRKLSLEEIPPVGYADSRGYAAGSVLEKLGTSPLTGEEIGTLLSNRYALSLVFKRSYGNPRMLMGLLAGRVDAVLKPAPVHVHEAVCCIAEWFLENQHETVMSVVDDPFSFRCEDFALTPHELLQQNAERRRVDELMDRAPRVSLKDMIFYDLCDTGYMEPCHVPGDATLVVKFAVSSVTTLFIGLSKASALKGISTREAKLFDALQVDNAGELLEPTVMRQLVECMERQTRTGERPRTNLFFGGDVAFTGRDPLTWGSDPKEYPGGTVDFSVPKSGTVLRETPHWKPGDLAQNSAVANEKPDDRGADYVYATFGDPAKKGLIPPRPDLEGGGWSGTEELSLGDGVASKEELWIARFQIRLGKQSRAFGKGEAEELTTMLDEGGFVPRTKQQLRVGGQHALNHIFLRELDDDRTPPRRVRVNWLWVLVTSRHVTKPAATHLGGRNVLVWDRRMLWQSLGMHLRIIAAHRGWEKIGYDGPSSLSRRERRLAAAVGVPKEVTDRAPRTEGGAAASDATTFDCNDFEDDTQLTAPSGPAGSAHASEVAQGRMGASARRGRTSASGAARTSTDGASSLTQSRVELRGRRRNRAKSRKD